ncbi:MAG: heavy-metal-associated domain-containing protein [Bacteriovoracia bacterium]
MYELTVTGMSCNNCVKHVKEAITKADAKGVVDVELATGSVKVTTTLSLADVKALIEDAGYDVTAQRES